jgi:hypothetical protein
VQGTGSVDYPVKQVSGALNLGLIFEQKRRLAFGDGNLHLEIATLLPRPVIRSASIGYRAPRRFAISLQVFYLVGVRVARGLPGSVFAPNYPRLPVELAHSRPFHRFTNHLAFSTL